MDFNVEIHAEDVSLMSTKYTWKKTMKIGSEPIDSPPPGKKKRGVPFQELSDELFNLGDMLSCHIFDMNGNIKGVNFGTLDVDPELKERFAEIAAVVWGGLKRVENIGGPITMVSAMYQNFKILGIPFDEQKFGVLAVVPNNIDSYVLRERVVDFVDYWMQGLHKK
jgi:hypothetical protein